MQRRNFLQGLLAAPAIVHTPGLLMPVKAQKPASVLILPQEEAFRKFYISDISFVSELSEVKLPLPVVGAIVHIWNTGNDLVTISSNKNTLKPKQHKQFIAHNGVWVPILKV